MIILKFLRYCTMYYKNKGYRFYMHYTKSVHDQYIKKKIMKGKEQRFYCWPSSQKQFIHSDV